MRGPQVTLYRCFQDALHLTKCLHCSKMPLHSKPQANHDFSKKTMLLFQFVCSAGTACEHASQMVSGKELLACQLFTHHMYSHLQAFCHRMESRSAYSLKFPCHKHIVIWVTCHMVFHTCDEISYSNAIVLWLILVSV